MKDVFDTPQEEVPQGETEVEVTTTDEAAAPPAADTEKHVPLAALEAERGQRKDWKEKALRYEGELKAMREQRLTQESPRESDPLQEAVAAAQNERLDTSEMLAREKFGDETVDKAFEQFQEAVRRDPTLYQRVMGQKHPWGFVVKEMQKAALLAEIGDDPAAYKERLKAEFSNPAPAAPRAPLPASLAGSRSTASRSAGAFSGPPDFKDIFS